MRIGCLGLVSALAIGAFLTFGAAQHRFRSGEMEIDPPEYVYDGNDNQDQFKLSFSYIPTARELAQHGFTALLPRRGADVMSAVKSGVSAGITALLNKVAEDNSSKGSSGCINGDSAGCINSTSVADIVKGAFKQYEYVIASSVNTAVLDLVRSAGRSVRSGYKPDSSFEAIVSRPGGALTARKRQRASSLQFGCFSAALWCLLGGGLTTSSQPIPTKRA